MAGLARTQPEPAPDSSAPFSKDPFSGQQELFDLGFEGFNRLDYADVRGKETSSRA